MLKIKNLNFNYEKDKPVLKNINLSIRSGEFVGIVGPNGCGKSTLINLLCRVLDFYHGTILLENQSLKNFSQQKLARMIAVVPQESHFEFDFTTLEIVLMGRLPYLSRLQFESANDKKLAKKMMELTKCWEFRAKYIKYLSGGEKQRVIVARALVQQPRYLLLDEPTSHLDLNFQYEIMDIISQLNQNEKVTIISVFHDINLASRYCSRLLIMKEGQIIADGSPDVVINHENLTKIYGFDIILKHHPKEGYTYILPDVAFTGNNLKGEI
jgi:iron complex transport system ATP-binding protein